MEHNEHITSLSSADGEENENNAINPVIKQMAGLFTKGFPTLRKTGIQTGYSRHDGNDIIRKQETAEERSMNHNTTVQLPQKTSFGKTYPNDSNTSSDTRLQINLPSLDQDNSEIKVTIRKVPPPRPPPPRFLKAKRKDLKTPPSRPPPLILKKKRPNARHAPLARGSGKTELGSARSSHLRTGTSNRRSRSLSDDQCIYYRKCLDVIKELKISDDLLDLQSKYNKCYCSNCHKKRNESHYHREGSGSNSVYTKPLGWGRIMLQLPPRAKSLKIFPDWNVAYHGTTVKSVIPILNSGMLLIPGDRTIHGFKIQEQAGHYNEEWKPKGFNTKLIYLSPSIKYAGCDVYSKKERMTLRRFKTDVNVRVAFQVRVHSGYIKIGRETIGLKKALDPPIDNESIEWSTEARDGVIPIALLIKIEDIQESGSPADVIPEVPVPPPAPHIYHHHVDPLETKPWPGIIVPPHASRGNSDCLLDEILRESDDPFRYEPHADPLPESVFEYDRYDRYDDLDDPDSLDDWRKFMLDDDSTHFTLGASNLSSCQFSISTPDLLASESDYEGSLPCEKHMDLHDGFSDYHYSSNESLSERHMFGSSNLVSSNLSKSTPNLYEIESSYDFVYDTDLRLDETYLDKLTETTSGRKHWWQPWRYL